MPAPVQFRPELRLSLPLRERRGQGGPQLFHELPPLVVRQGLGPCEEFGFRRRHIRSSVTPPFYFVSAGSGTLAPAASFATASGCRRAGQTASPASGCPATRQRPEPSQASLPAT